MFRYDALKIISLEETVDTLTKENERLAARDCNASVQLVYQDGIGSFVREDLQIVDVGVSDNIYIVESKLLKDALIQITALTKKVEVLRELIIELNEDYQSAPPTNDWYSRSSKILADTEKE